MVANIVTSYNDAEVEIVSSSRIDWCSTIAGKEGVVGSGRKYLRWRFLEFELIT